jgi:uncharacterized protein YjiS (DUF1127 family)
MTTTFADIRPTGLPAKSHSVISAWLRLAAGRVAVMLQVARERRRLQALTAHELRDVGLDYGAAVYEAGRPFWDVPRAR